MENIVLNLNLMRCMKGTLLAYVIWCHIKVAQILPGYDAYLTLDEEMITRAPIINARSNLKITHKILNKTYHSSQVDKCMINKDLVFQILSKVFTNTDTYVYANSEKQCRMVKQCTSMFTSVFLVPIM